MPIVDRLNKRILHRYRGYLYILPLMAVMVAIVVYPMIHNLAMVFTDYSVRTKIWTFVGLKNSATLFEADNFWLSCRVTLVWTLANIALQMISGMIVALCFDRVRKLSDFLSGFILLPWISCYVVVSVIWMWITHPQLGVLNDILLRLHLIPAPVAWYNTPALSMFSLVLINSWKHTPIIVITLFAGLQDIPPDLYEVAKVEGAGKIAIFRRITIPLLQPSIYAGMILATVWAYNSFTLPFIMTGGGPLRATEILGLFIYKQAFVSYDFGSAAAGSLFLFTVIFFVIWIYGRLLRRDYQ
jgi:multiple sugar transport system permease protein